MSTTQIATTTISQYLLDRLLQLGVHHIFGVPGDYVLRFDKRIRPVRRSDCAVACTLDIIGDRWTLLIVRDLLRGMRYFDDFLRSPEGIATNILAAPARRCASRAWSKKSQTRPISAGTHTGSATRVCASASCSATSPPGASNICRARGSCAQPSQSRNEALVHRFGQTNRILQGPVDFRRPSEQRPRSTPTADERRIALVKISVKSDYPVAIAPREANNPCLNRRHRILSQERTCGSRPSTLRTSSPAPGDESG